MPTTPTFLHHFEPATEARHPPLLLLHGTGGDESDLLPLGEAVAPGAALLSPRGKILENGMPRFFRRLAEGIFDEGDVRFRAGELADFTAAAQQRYGLAKPVALGFSNGANIAAAMLLERPGVLAGAILLRAMPPFANPMATSLDGLPVLILSGQDDPIVPASGAASLAESLRHNGALVTHTVLPGGHGLTQRDVDEARRFYALLQA